VTPFLIYSVLSALLFAVALHGLIVQPQLLRKVLALNIMGSSVFLFLVAVAYRNADPAPDPVPHAMVLTGIVVAVSATALALAVARRLADETGLDRLPERDEEQP
jgi:multicomponent Na+:H+ antiporter subunit C